MQLAPGAPINKRRKTIQHTAGQQPIDETNTTHLKFACFFAAQKISKLPSAEAFRCDFSACHRLVADWMFGGGGKRGSKADRLIQRERAEVAHATDARISTLFFIACQFISAACVPFTAPQRSRLLLCLLCSTFTLFRSTCFRLPSFTIEKQNFRSPQVGSRLDRVDTLAGLHLITRLPRLPTHTPGTNHFLIRSSLRSSRRQASARLFFCFS